MSNLMLASAVKAEIALNDVRNLIMKRRERGADALEYVGMVVLAASIIGALVLAVKPAEIGEAFGKAVTKIITGKA